MEIIASPMMFPLLAYPFVIVVIVAVTVWTKR